MYKINLKSVTNILNLNSAWNMDVCPYECWVFSGTYQCNGSITISDEICNLCICVGVLVC